MKKSLILPALITLIFFSCQKEIDWSTDTDTPADLMLYRIKSKTGTTDSTQTDYFYDANKKLTRELVNGFGNGQNLNNELIISRNASGIITKTVQKAAALLAAGIDSLVTMYNYNTGTSKYTYSVFELIIAGFSIRDSAVYTYDASGRISKDEHYLQLTGLPIPVPPVLSARNTYSYSADGKNVLSVVTDAATVPGGPLTPATAQTYMVDTKVNALIILNEGVLLLRPGLYNANNSIKAIVTNTIDPAQNLTMDFTYRYNSSNKPDSSYGTRTPGGAVTATKYFYQ